MTEANIWLISSVGINLCGNILMFRIPGGSAKPSLVEEGLGSCLSLLDVTNELRMLAILLVEK